MSTLQHLSQVAIPHAPPCFSSRSLWLSFVHSAAEVQRVDKRGPILLVAGQPPRFDMRFDFCVDCCYSAQDLRQLRALNLCRPDWLRDGARETLIKLVEAASAAA